LQISFTLFVACALVGVHYGTGRHFDDLELPDIQQAMKVDIEPKVQHACY
jgi:hypothetical protein